MSFYSHDGERRRIPSRVSRNAAAFSNRAPDRPLRLALFQMASNDLGADARLERLDALLRETGGTADLLVCPELFLSGYDIGERLPELAQPSDGPFARAVAGLARKWGTAVAYGYPEEAAGRFHNSAICFDKKGDVLANFRKLHQCNAFERANFTPGEELVLFDLEGWRVGMLICYDFEFPETVRGYALAGADLVVAPTGVGDRWSVISERVVPARAFENGLFVAYANYGGAHLDGRPFLGKSCIASPHGTDLARAEDARETMLTATLDRAAIREARERIAYLEDRRSLG
ncbi:carbon-nitrogen hydrolase family protein [Chelativorans xinjiangense]|uniref:carbon-nitrogen hydrolase family protein n=1 Tax=Chelativorans xinjiangense TaxID=2681485 RepID=UPI00135C23B3|nr:carbon-nitrogen hydrolase family protein [Chelativorans xinjiangense]